jgi:hypothetical protein
MSIQKKQTYTIDCLLAETYSAFANNQITGACSLHFVY